MASVHEEPGKGKKRIEVIARGLLRSGSKILLCRNTEHGYDYLPGGHVEFGETAAQACSREFMEETGLDVTPSDCLLVAEVLFDQGGRRRHEVNLVFHVERTRGEQGPASEGEDQITSRESGIDFHWIDLASVSDIDLRPAAIRAWLVTGGSVASGVTTAWTSADESVLP